MPIRVVSVPWRTCEQALSGNKRAKYVPRVCPLKKRLGASNFHASIHFFSHLKRHLSNSYFCH